MFDIVAKQHIEGILFQFFIVFIPPLFQGKNVLQWLEILSSTLVQLFFLNFHFFPQMDEKEDVIPK